MSIRTETRKKIFENENFVSKVQEDKAKKANIIKMNSKHWRLHISIGEMILNRIVMLRRL